MEEIRRRSVKLNERWPPDVGVQNGRFTGELSQKHPMFMPEAAFLSPIASETSFHVIHYMQCLRPAIGTFSGEKQLTQSAGLSEDLLN